MIIVSVLYPKSPSSHFDHEYYTRNHIPLVQSLWSSLGLERIDLMRGVAALDGSPPAYELIGNLTFLSPGHLQDALAQGATVLADIPNFTNIQPIIQTNQVVTL
jgi:uncharacterized protein (TIGR02118 family)